jgi:hypothetical protein
MRNNGWHSKAYSFGKDAELNLRLSQLINEMCHVFHLHADGNWKSLYKPKYVERVAIEIRNRPSLIRKLLALDDPVVSNITHAAIDFNKQDTNEST